MRSVLCIVLSVFLFLLPVFAYPGYGQDIDARADEVVDYHWPKPSGTHHWKREPYPSPKPGHPHEYKKRAEQETVVTPPHDGDFSRDLCPYGMTACPINAVQGHTCSKPTSLLDWIREGFECTDVQVDLNSCGGCGSVDRSYDCMAIPGALGVSCLKGQCHIDFCQSGYKRSLDGKSCLRAL